MATTSLWSVKGWLGNVLIYTQDPDKTTTPKSFKVEGADDSALQGLADVIAYASRDDATAERQLITGINCCADTAREQMMAVKAHYGKADGIVAFHGYQSFKPGETTPEQAHEIGVKLAKRCWSDRFQVLVCTHVDKEHLHNHFVINSVSHIDGRRFHRSKQCYADMHKASDELCREYGLSIVEQQSKNKALYIPEHDGKLSWRAQVKNDVDKAVSMSLNDDILDDQLKYLGYEVRWGEQLALRPPNRNRFVYLEDTYGKDYSMKSLTHRVVDKMASYMLHDNKFYHPRIERSMFDALYRASMQSIAILFQLIAIILELHAQAPRHEQFPGVRNAVKHRGNYEKSYLLLKKYGIDTFKQLDELIPQLQQDIATLEHERQPLYYAIKKEEDPERKAIMIALRDEINKKLKQLRHDLKDANRVDRQPMGMVKRLMLITGKTKESKEQTRLHRSQYRDLSR
jgi:hypothetical protein